MKTAKLELNGKIYTMCFSLRVTRDLTDRFGGMEAMQEAVTSKDPTKALDAVVWMLAAMSRAGSIYDKRCGIETEEPLTEDDLFDGVGVDDLQNLRAKMFEAITTGQKADIQVEAETNAETSPGAQ